MWEYENDQSMTEKTKAKFDLLTWKLESKFLDVWQYHRPKITPQIPKKSVFHNMGPLKVPKGYSSLPN